MVGVKTPCEVSRNEFRAAAKPLALTVDGRNLVLSPKEFSTGSLGFHANGTIQVNINGKLVKCVGNFMLTIANSKELPAE